MLYLLFGEMGIGKNYVGERLAAFLKCDFLDGDLVATQKMIDKVTKFEPLSVEIIDDYVYNHLTPFIEENFDKKQNLVVSQALYFDKHRQHILNHFGHETTKLVYLPVTSFMTHMKRLYSRKNGFRWTVYGITNKPWFEKPKSGFEKIISNNNLHLQFTNLIKVK